MTDPSIAELVDRLAALEAAVGLPQPLGYCSLDNGAIRGFTRSPEEDGPAILAMGYTAAGTARPPELDAPYSAEVATARLRTARLGGDPPAAIDLEVAKDLGNPAGGWLPQIWVSAPGDRGAIHLDAGWGVEITGPLKAAVYAGGIPQPLAYAQHYATHVLDWDSLTVQGTYVALADSGAWGGPPASAGVDYLGTVLVRQDPVTGYRHVIQELHGVLKGVGVVALYRRSGWDDPDLQQWTWSPWVLDPEFLTGAEAVRYGAALPGPRRRRRLEFTDVATVGAGGAFTVPFPEPLTGLLQADALAGSGDGQLTAIKPNNATTSQTQYGGTAYQPGGVVVPAETPIRVNVTAIGWVA